MIPIGYMAKRIPLRPDWLKAPQVMDIYSVSSCVNDNFADYVPLWKHNGFWFFDSPEAIQETAKRNEINLEQAKLFYYAAHDLEFDGEAWQRFAPDSSFGVNVVHPEALRLEGYDVVTFSQGTSAECSPLSCNSLAEKLSTNAHCLFQTLEEGVAHLEQHAFVGCEAGPYRIYSVSSVDWR